MASTWPYQQLSVTINFLKLDFFVFLRFLFKKLLFHRLDHKVKSCSNGHQACHGVHRVVVDERRRVEGARWHDGHQFGDGQSLGLNQGLCLRQICAENFLETPRVDFAQQIWSKKGWFQKFERCSGKIDTIFTKWLTLTILCEFQY